MNKKVGCVLAYGCNFGTMLQSYATIHSIKKLGYDCEIIRYVKHDSILKKASMVFRALRIGDISDQIRAYKQKFSMLLHPDYKTNRAIQKEAFEKFGEKYLKPLFHEYDGYDALCKGALNYDIVLVGSDQLWTPMSLYGNYYNLMFVDDKISKVAYAASFGVSEIPAFQRDATKTYLDRFARIGVREIQGKKIVDSLSINKATHVSDPSMLLNADEWRGIASSKIEGFDINDEPYIFCLLLGPNMEARQAAKELRKKTGMKIVAVVNLDEYVSGDEEFCDISLHNIAPDNFLHLVANASYVCTDSFHCSIFSILFHRQFMIFYRYAVTKKGGRNSRIDSLLTKFGLETRLFSGDITAIDQPIDYDNVDRLVADFREMSLKFLSDSLSL